MKKLSITILVAVFFVAGFAFAGDEYAVKLKTRFFTPAANSDVGSALIELSGRHVLVQLKETPNAKQRESMMEKGVTLLHPISGRTWLARISDYSGDRAAEIRWVGELAASDKIQDSVKRREFASFSAYEDGLRVLDVGMHKDVAEGEGRRALKNAGAVILEYTHLTNSFLAAIDPASINTLAVDDAVVFISEAGPALRPMMDLAKPAVGGDTASQPPYSVTGAGVTAFVLDGGTVSVGSRVHTDLEGRVTISGFPMPDVIGHPSHVSCTVAGSGAASNGLYQGMAPEAHLVSSSIIPGLRLPPMYNSPSNIATAYQAAVQEHGATVANNSIGSNLAQFGEEYCDKEGDYERSAQLIDRIVAEAYGRITIVWANGNERGYDSCGTTYFTTAPPATAKNVIAVGATNKEDMSMTSFSSFGPVDDGRIRPDISAPGCSTTYQEGGGIISCNSPLFEAFGEHYTSFCGTSMAAPVVTGSVALAQEYWRRQISEEDARASTMKALLIHGADAVEEPGPDFKFGYGNLNVPKVLDLIDDALIYEESLDQGESFSVSLEATGDPVKVTLVWTDPEGELLAERVLVNDLDLSVETSEGVELPWLLDSEHPSLDATKGVNTLDPVEMVEFTAMKADELFEVVVTGSDVPLGPQVFSLVITGLDHPAEEPDDDDDTNEAVDDDVAGDDDDDDDSDGTCGC
jgi:subtilisin family serine protease